MKIFKLTYGLMAATMLSLASCDINEYPEFDDADAFVAFTSSSKMASESQGSVEIPVMLTSLSGLSANIQVEVVPDTTGKGAVEGKDFNIPNKTLSFTKDAPTQNITVNIVDNDEFTGNKSFTILLKSEGGVNLGASKTCVVTIEDDEHPLLFILGTYAVSADSYYRGHFDWEVTIGRDDTDNNKVWISDLNPYFGSYGYVAPKYNYFYGVVNEDKTQILVPVGQKLGYDDAALVAFSDPDGDGEFYETSGNLIIDIQDGGAKLVLPNAWGIYEGGWWDLYLGGVTMIKK